MYRISDAPRAKSRDCCRGSLIAAVVFSGVCHDRTAMLLLCICRCYETIQCPARYEVGDHAGEGGAASCAMAMKPTR